MLRLRNARTGLASRQGGPQDRNGRARTSQWDGSRPGSASARCSGSSRFPVPIRDGHGSAAAAPRHRRWRARTSIAPANENATRTWLGPRGGLRMSAAVGGRCMWLFWDAVPSRLQDPRQDFDDARIVLGPCGRHTHEAGAKPGISERSALLHKLGDSRTSPFPGRTCPTASVMGLPSAVKPFSTATRTWNSAT